jgi:hypothetical protein
VWHTFAGGAVNRLLAAGLEQTSGKRWVAGNLSLRCKDVPVTAAGDAVRKLAGLDWESVASSAARGMARGMVSKFQPCLPEDAENRLLAERLLDLVGTLRFIGSVSVGGVRIAGCPSGTRLREGEATAPVALFQVIARPGGTARPTNEVEWVDTPAALRAVSEVVAREDVIGLDVETALDFGTLCLIQVATRNRTFLIDPFAVGDLAPLGKVLSLPKPLKIIHNAQFERRVLATLGITLDSVFDTLEASRQARGIDVLGGHGLAMVCERELGMGLDKSSQTSNWSRRPLDSEQLSYAALDAEILLAVYDRFARQTITHAAVQVDSDLYRTTNKRRHD